MPIHSETSVAFMVREPSKSSRLLPMEGKCHPFGSIVSPVLFNLILLVFCFCFLCFLFCFSLSCLLFVFSVVNYVCMSFFYFSYLKKDNGLVWFCYVLSCYHVISLLIVE